MKAVSSNPHRVEAARDGQEPGHARHGGMKCRVKAGHLGQVRMALTECLDQLDLAGQMVRVVGSDAMQFVEQFSRDALGLGVVHAVDHPVSHCQHVRETGSLFEESDQDARCRPVIGGLDVAAALFLPRRVVKRQIRAGQADAVNLPVKTSLQRCAGPVQAELDARRAAVDGKHGPARMAGRHVRPVFFMQFLPLDFYHLRFNEMK